VAVQLSVAARNARLDTLESTVGTGAVLKVFTGSPPASCAASDTGTLLVQMSLPSDWMAAASGGSKVKLGTWSGSGSGSGTPGYFRVYDSGVTTCHAQGTAGGPSAVPTPNLLLDGDTIAPAQAVAVTGFTLTDGNA
jgi:hypothetical protein